MSKAVLLLSLFLMIVGGIFFWWTQSSQSQRISLTLPEVSPPLFKTSTEPVILPPPSFDSIFALGHGWIATLSSTKVTRVAVTGDVLTARTVNAKTLEKNDFTWAFQKTAEVLKQADITFINLETPIIPDCPVILGGFTFCGDQRHTQGLLFAGVDVVNLANNHMGNYGIEGVESTRQILNQAGIKHTGINGPMLLEFKGTTFAFLGYNEVDRQPGVPYPSNELIISEVQAARQTADVVIVQFHWGNEYTYKPSSNQQRLAHLAIDNGADLVVSNHPHWWQPLEFYQGKAIVYSHGNFVFDQMWSEETREGIVGLYTFYENQLIDIEFLPVKIEDYGQPRWLESEEKIRVLNRLQQESKLMIGN